MKKQTDQERNPFKIIDSRILTAQEYKLIGASPTRDQMSNQPFMPHGLIEGSLSLKEIISLRREQKEILSNAVPLLFGISDPDKSLIIELSDLDPVSGEVEDRIPKIAGLYSEETEEIVRDQEVLGEYQLTDEAKRELFIERTTVLASASKEREN